MGKGGFGIVYLIEYKQKKYALKKIPLITLEMKDIISCEKVIEILTSINNEYIVKYYYSFKDKHYFNVVMEYAGDSDLKQFIQKYIDKGMLIEENIIIDIIKQIYLVLKEIQKYKIIHRDLKPENIFINEKNKIKICDFGISKILEGNKSHLNSKSGTVYYRAPEMDIENKCDDKTDIYSFGCIIYELFTSHIYYIDKEENKIEKIDLKEYDKKWQELINLLLKKKYNQRPDIEEISKYFN